MERLNAILNQYNSGAHDIDQLLEDLVDLAKGLDDEDQRAVKENLSEDELAIFDLLVKESIDPTDVEKLRKVSHHLLEELKEKLVIDWRDREATRAGVKTTIFDILYASLPEPTYSEEDCETKGLEVYNFVYERYKDSKDFINKP